MANRKPLVPPTTETTFRALIRSYGLVRRVMGPFFFRAGISGSQWGVLRALYRGEREGTDGLRLKDLGARLLVRPPSVTRVVERLDRLGLVDRVALASDLRAKCVRLTPTGRRLVESLVDGHGERMRDILSALTLTQQRQLHRLLTQMSDRLETIAEQADRSGIL